MKRLFTILIAIVLTMDVFAQTPEKMSYQAVIRNAGNGLVTNQLVGMRISILQGSAAGTAVYVETQAPTTNINGLVTVEIGAGTVVSGNFSAVDWKSSTYFIKTETDPAGGNNYTITGTSQLLSVPYALHAKTVDSLSGTIKESQISDLGAYIKTEIDPVFSAWDKSTGISIQESQISDLGTYVKTEVDPVFSASVAQKITADDTLKWNSKQNKLVAGTGIIINGDTVKTADAGTGNHYIGELYGGGVVFWVDQTQQHGLIVSMVDLSTAQAWSNIQATSVGSTSDWDGKNNSAAIIAQAGHTSSAAKLCDDYVNVDYGTGVFSDWYLPSITELIHVWNNLYEIQKALTNDNNAATTTIVKTYYYSSTEYDFDFAYRFIFKSGQIEDASKQDALYVRAVRAF